MLSEAPKVPSPSHPARTGEPLPVMELEATRGLRGIKEAAVKLPVNATTVKGGCAGKEVRKPCSHCDCASFCDARVFVCWAAC